MALINKDNTLNWVLITVKKMPVNSSIEILSYKRNRSIKVFKKEGYLQVLEKGFYNEEFKIKTEELKGLLKKLLRREFPRSHKLWVFKHIILPTPLSI